MQVWAKAQPVLIEMNDGSETVAVHLQDGPVEMLKLPVTPAAATVALAGFKVNVQGCGGTTVSSTGTVSNWFTVCGAATPINPDPTLPLPGQTPTLSDQGLLSQPIAPVDPRRLEIGRRLTIPQL